MREDRYLILAPLTLGLLFLIWISVNHDIYFDTNVYLPRDNAHAQLTSFSSVVHQLASFKYFPDWFYSKEGGVWMPTLSNLLTALAPHRFFGYFWAAFSSVDLNTAYKSSFLVVGQGVYLMGVFLVLRHLLASSLWAAFPLIPFFFTSNILSFIHQESSFSVVFFIPFIWLFYLKIKESPRWFVALCAVMGYALNQYYPQLQLCYLLAGAISFLICWKTVKKPFLERCRMVLSRPRLMVLGAFVFAVTSLPAIYSYLKYWDSIGSPLRQREGSLAATTYSELVSMQSTRCHINPKNIQSYFGLGKYIENSMDPHDALSLFVGPPMFLLLILLLSFGLRARRFYLSMVVLLALLAVGFYGPLPRLLWFWVPGMKMFRQYYHFVELFNLHLALLCVMVVKEICERLRNQRKARGFLLGALFLWIGYSNISWSVNALEMYRKTFRQTLIAEEILEPRKLRGQDLANELLLEQKYPYEAGIKTVKPKGLPFRSYSKLWGTFGGIHFRSVGSRLRQSSEDLSVGLESGAFSIYIHRAPSNPNSVEILQYNDGNWRVEDSRGRMLALDRGELGNLSIPGVHSGQKLLLRRNVPIWNYIVFTAFGCLLLGILFPLVPLKVFKRLYPKRLWLPAPTFSIKTHSL